MKNRYALRHAVLLGCLGLSGCSTDPADTLDFSPMVISPLGGGKVIGPEGGSLSVGPLTLEFPAGAVAERVRITVLPVQPGRPPDPTDEVGAAVPTHPAATSPVWVQPEGLVLSQPVRITFASGGDVTTMALALALPQQDRSLAWEPLAGQQRSPGLLRSLSNHLGVLGVVQVDCCSGTSGVGDCSLRCDVGPLHYQCDGSDQSMTCCDPFVDGPVAAPLPLCQGGGADMGM